MNEWMCRVALLGDGWLLLCVHANHLGFEIWANGRAISNQSFVVRTQKANKLRINVVRRNRENGWLCAHAAHQRRQRYCVASHIDTWLPATQQMKMTILLEVYERKQSDAVIISEQQRWWFSVAELWWDTEATRVKHVMATVKLVRRWEQVRSRASRSMIILAARARSQNTLLRVPP